MKMTKREPILCERCAKEIVTDGAIQGKEVVVNGLEKDRRGEKPEHVEFVDRWKLAYETNLPGEIFKQDRHHFIVAKRLINAYGLEMVIRKANTFFILCKNKSSWFTRNGFADFSIEKLSSMWNKIIPESHTPTKDEEFMAELRKQEALRERSNRLIDR